MWIELSVPQLIAVNCVGIPLAHLFVSWAVTRLPSRLFREDTFLFRRRGWEREGRVYEDSFRVRRWKRYLPDAAPWFRGESKKHIETTDGISLRNFVSETRRGELAHWLQMLLIFGFVTWNPYPATWVIVVYALLSNLPCIVSLRHTRHRMMRILRKRRQQ